MRFILGIFFVLHGLVHMLYFAQSRRFFELKPGMVWPDGSWAFSGLFGDAAAKSVGSIACVVAALGFVTAGLALVFGQGWWRPAVVSAAAISTLLFVLLWNGSLQKLDEQGAVAILINAAVLIAVLIFRWPDFGF